MRTKSGFSLGQEATWTGFAGGGAVAVGSGAATVALKSLAVI